MGASQSIEMNQNKQLVPRKTNQNKPVAPSPEMNQNKPVVTDANFDKGAIMRWSVKELKEATKEQLKGLTYATFFKSTMSALTCIFKSKQDLMNHLYSMTNQFHWFKREDAERFKNMENASQFFAKDFFDVKANSHICGYIVWYMKLGKDYWFRSCFIEYHERIKVDGFEQYLIGAGAIVGEGAIGAGAGMAIGAGVGGVAEVATVCAAGGAVAGPPGMVVGAGIGAVVGLLFGVGHCVKINMDARKRRHRVQEQLGMGIYDAESNRVNTSALVEGVALHYLLKDQRYDIPETKEIEVFGLTETKW